MKSSANRSHHEPLSVMRMDARLDSATRAKVDALARHFHQPRAAVVSYIMQWGLSHGQTSPRDQGDAQRPVHHLSLYVESELYARVEKAAAAVGMKIAPWLRHMVCRISITDFPMTWQEATSEKRSHDSYVYGTRFMLRLDEPSEAKLQRLVKQFSTSKAEIIRHLIAQANEKDFPRSWQMRTDE